MNFGHFYPLPRLTFLPLLLNHPSQSPPTLMSICVCRQPLDLTGVACMNTHGGIYWRIGFLSVATSLRKNDIPPPSPLTANSFSGRGGGLMSPSLTFDEMFPGPVSRKRVSHSVITLPCPLGLPKKGCENILPSRLDPSPPATGRTPLCSLPPTHIL